jgi:hypothetical protein
VLEAVITQDRKSSGRTFESGTKAVDGTQVVLELFRYVIDIVGTRNLIITQPSSHTRQRQGRGQRSNAFMITGGNQSEPPQNVRVFD